MERPKQDLADLESDGYLAFDLTPDQLLGVSPLPDGLSGILTEIKRQWSHDARIGTMYVYFEPDGRLHLNFIERGSYLQPERALAEVPSGPLPSWLAGKSNADTKAKKKRRRKKNPGANRKMLSKLMRG